MAVAQAEHIDQSLREHPIKVKPFQNLAANLLQLIANQAFGLGIFFILSASLSKDIFGNLNFALALLLVVFNILSFGIDQIIVKKVAAGENAGCLLNSYLFHVVATGTIFYLILLLINFLSPQMAGGQNILLLIAIGKTAIFFSTPFKQLTAGFEQFKVLSKMSVVSNMVRCLALVVLFFLKQLNLNSVLIIFVAGDIAELLLTFVLFKVSLKLPLAFKFVRTGYLQLLKDAAPQSAIVIFTSALARFDWIFLGFWAPAENLAEYSFAYKIFEIATMPLLVLAPLLVPRFTKLFTEKTAKQAQMNVLLRIEVVIAVFVALVLCISWSPVVDWVTANKYGRVNLATILILSVSMPLLYVNNFLWSVAFAKGRLKMILWVIALTFVANVIANIILIPILNKEGAAIAYTFAMLIQAVAYLKYSDENSLNQSWQTVLACIACAALSGLIAHYLFAKNLAATSIACGLYFMCLLLFRLLRRGDIKQLSAMLSGEN